MLDTTRSGIESIFQSGRDLSESPAPHLNVLVGKHNIENATTEVDGHRSTKHGVTAIAEKPRANDRGS
jgi:hypothetical protein